MTLRSDTSGLPSGPKPTKKPAPKPMKPKKGC
jgi:hypothetical protein